MPFEPADPYATVRRLLLALLALGLAGTSAELVLMEHYEDPKQLVPLFAIAVALGSIAAQAAANNAKTTRMLQVVMVLLMATGVAGVVLHYLGNLGFQRDMDPTASQWELFKKVVRAKAPPALAPGAMAEFGLLGLISTYRHPAIGRGRQQYKGASS